MSEIKAGDICVFKRGRFAVRVEYVDPNPSEEQNRTAVCRTLNDSVAYKADYRFFPPLSELTTVEKLCEEYSDFMTFTAAVMNIAPKDEPANKSIVWHFWNLGRQARMHLLKWNVRQQLE